MSKYVKDLITKELSRRLDGIEGVGVINPRGINATKNNQLRRRLREKGLRVSVVKNSLARRATQGTKLNGFDKLLDGPSAVIYGKSTSISTLARLLLDEKKLDDKIELRGIFFDGETYVGDEGVKTVSKLPTREEAIGNIMSAILGPGRKLAAALKGPGSTIAGILKSIEEKAPATAAEEAPAVDAAPAADAAAPAAAPAATPAAE